VVVSFNALHWIRRQDEALRSICAAMKPRRASPASTGLQRKAEEPGTCARGDVFLGAMGAVLQGFPPTLPAREAGAYSGMTEHNGLRVIDVQCEDKSWDFESRSAFEAFGKVTFVEWRTDG
jgi:trans-aconitate 2-methyltransferase